jgi:hypothetical protein
LRRASMSVWSKTISTALLPKNLIAMKPGWT